MPEARFFRRGVWVMARDLKPGDLIVGQSNYDPTQECLYVFTGLVDYKYAPSHVNVTTQSVMCTPVMLMTLIVTPETLVELAIPEITFEQYRETLIRR